MNVLFSKITSDPFRIFSRLARQSRRHPHTRVHKNIGDLSNNSSPEKLGPTHGLATFDWSPAPLRPDRQRRPQLLNAEPRSEVSTI